MSGAVNAGRVELDLVAIARDQVSATLREINGSLKKTKDEMEGAASTNRSLNESTKKLSDNMREGVKPLNNMREGFENVRSNGLFLVSAFTGIGGALVGLIAKLGEGSSALAELTDRAKEFEGGRSAMQRGIAFLKEQLGIVEDASKKAYEAAVDGASTSFQELLVVQAAIVENNTEAVNAYVRMQREQAKLTKEGASQSRLASERAQSEYAIERILDRNIPLVTSLRELSSETAEFEKLRMDYLRQQSDEMLKQLSPAYQLFTYLQGVKPTGAGPGGPSAPPRGGSSGMTSADAEAGWREKMGAANDDDLDEAGMRRLMRRVRRAGGGDEVDADEARKSLAIEEEKAWEEAKALLQEAEVERIDKLAESYENLGSVIGEALSPNFQQFARDLGDVFAAMAKIEDANERGIVGAAGMAKAVTDLGAAEAATARDKYAWKAAGEAAEAIAAAARYDFWAAAAHGAAAVAFGVAAATAGGGGSRSSASSGGGGMGGGPSSLDREGGGGAQQNIWHVTVAPGTDPQSVARELLRVQSAARGTSSRAPFRSTANPGV